MWSSRMEYILNNTLLALLDYPGSTLLGINRLLADKKYRKRVVAKLTDPVVKAFWQNEFASYNDRYAQEAVAPIQNKIGQFLSANVIRNMVAQVKSTIDIREIMDNKKILIMNLSKGRIGEDNSRLLGGMLITKIQLAAMERVDTPEAERKDFFLYVDEFQNFATASFANILSEARKYRLSLIMAHQYVAQLDEAVSDAVFGNIGSTISFRVGGPDAEVLAKEYAPTFMEEDLVNLSKYHIFLKLMIDGVASQPFSAVTLPPIGIRTNSADKVIRVSRERYGSVRGEIEEKITRWSGMNVEGADLDEEQDQGSKKEKKASSKKKSPKSDKEQTGKASKQATPPVPEETVSLKDLLPAPEEKKEDNVDKKKQPEKPKAEKQTEKQPRSEEGKQESTDKNKKVDRQDADKKDEGKSKSTKKKKRRRRKKKKKPASGQEQATKGKKETQDKPKPQEKSGKQKNNSETSSGPQPINPDQVVKFD